MDYIKILLPFFLCAFAVQQFTEFINIILMTYFKKYESKKDFILMVSKILLSVLISCIGSLKIVESLTNEKNLPSALDYIITILFVSAGTEAINSILKYLQYSKENKKSEAEHEKTEESEDKKNLNVTNNFL